MARYDFNIWKVISRILPIKKRRVKLIAWLSSLCKYIRVVHSKFTTQADQWDEDIKYSPGYKMQVQQLLIDKFGIGIYIENNFRIPPIYFYEDDDLRNVYFFEDNNFKNSFFGDDGSFDPNFAYYTVFVPISIVFDQDEMEALLNKYTRSGMAYNIIII